MQFHSVPGKGHAMMQGPSEMRILMAFWAQVLKHKPLQPQGHGEDAEYVEIHSNSDVLRSMQSPAGPYPQ